MKNLLSIIRHYREALFPILGLALIWLAITFVTLLTGRGVIDDPGVLVSYLYNAQGVLIVFALAGAIQSHLFGFRTRNQDRADIQPALGDDIYDAVVSFVLLGLVSYCVLFR